MIKFLFPLFLLFPLVCVSQTEAKDVEQLKQEILLLRTDVDKIQVNLSLAQNKFKRSILVATIGYTVTIAGGLMLGRKNDELGKALLVSGGVTGITGTILMVDAFKYLGRAGRHKPK